MTETHLRSHTIDSQLARITSRMFGFVAAMVLLLQGGQHLGIPLSSLLAGAGVVGMALALSAQDVLKNVFGSIMIIFDKPFVAGARIKVMHYDGIVEEIGLRSTKIRLLNGHQASIVKELLVDHEGFNPDFPPRVWLNDFEHDQPLISEISATPPEE